MFSPRPAKEPTDTLLDEFFVLRLGDDVERAGASGPEMECLVSSIAQDGFRRQEFSGLDSSPSQHRPSFARPLITNCSPVPVNRIPNSRSKR